MAGMEDEREKHGSYAVPVACVIFLAIFVAYIGGYFGLTTSVAEIPEPDQAVPYRYIRLYPASWIAVAYRPLAWIESAVTGEGYCTGIEANEPEE
jgi:hypothetical protein